jgi:hypothetical protein
LHEIAELRDAAANKERTLLQTGNGTGVKVVKQSYHSQNGDELSLKTVGDGHDKAGADPNADDVPLSLTCSKPDDLYSYPARAAITRLVSDYLAKQKITVTELIHRSDALDKFEAAGTLCQHAIQRVAVAQAASTKMPVAQLVKDLNELVSKTIGRVYRDHRAGTFPALEPDAFPHFAAKVATAGNASYLINGTVARYLANARGWDEKLTRLLGLLTSCAAAETAHAHGHVLLRTSVDVITAEILSSSAALHELIGPHDNLGDALFTLIHLFRGEPRPDAQCGTGIALLTRHFAEDLLPEARTALANRVMAELNSSKKLSGDNVLDEVGILRNLATKLATGQSKYLCQEDIIAAFTRRSQRIVTNEVLARFLHPISLPGDKLEKLLLLEEGIFGAANKRQLASVMLPIAAGQAFAAQYADARVPTLERLRRLCELQQRVLRSAIPEPKRRELAEVLDRIATEVEGKARILEGLSAKALDPVEKVQILIKLAGHGAFTEGKLLARARALTLTLVNAPAFIDAFSAQYGLAETDALVALQTSLIKSGIASDTRLNSA